MVTIATAGRVRPLRVRRRGWLCAVLVAVVALNGCTTGFVYDRIHWIIGWYVGGLVTLDEAQEADLRALVDRTLAWHRQTQLPRYVAFLEDLAAEAQFPGTAAHFEQRFWQVNGFLEDFARRVVPDAAPLLRSLSAEQLSELAENLEEDNVDLWEEYAGRTPEDRARQRTRNAIRVTQRFVGRLDVGQKEAVESRLASMHDVSESWIERRRHWQERFIGLLSAPPDEKEFLNALLGLALDPNQFDSPAYRQQVDQNRSIIMDMLADLSAALGPRQRRHLQEKFRAYASDLRKIGGDAG